MVTEEHIAAFGWASQQDMEDILSLALRVNDFMSGLMLGVGIRLVDFKIEIGRVYEGDYQRLVIADEISPTAVVCGTSKQAANWIRTCSAAIWAI